MSIKILKKLLITGNSSWIHEKIQIHFEIKFVSLTDSIKHFECFFLMLLGSNHFTQLKSKSLN